MENQNQNFNTEEEIISSESLPRNAWNENIREVITNSTYQNMIENRELQIEAKKGNEDAAIILVKKLLDINIVTELSKKYPNAIVVPVPSIETADKKPNAIPLTYALVYQKLGLEILKENEIIEIDSVHHTGKTSFKRAVNRPHFAGAVQNGREYIIVDDVFTMGGTINSLRSYIENKGGNVVAVSTLTAGVENNKIIAITDKTIQELLNIDKQGELLNAIRKLDIAENFEALTEPIGRYISRNREKILNEERTRRTQINSKRNDEQTQRVNERLEYNQKIDKETTQHIEKSVTQIKSSTGKLTTDSTQESVTQQVEIKKAQRYHTENILQLNRSIGRHEDNFSGQESQDILSKLDEYLPQLKTTDEHIKADAFLENIQITENTLKLSVSWKPNTRDYASYVADVINTGNKTSLAPYLRSWKAEELSVQYNPVTGQIYDSIILGTHKELIGSKDNRWLTTNEIEEFNLKIKENTRPAVLLFRQGNGTTRAIKLVNASELLGLEAEKKHAKENGDKTISPKDERIENIFIAFRKAIKEGYNYKAPSNYKYEELSKETVLSLLKNTKISVKNQKNTILAKENSNDIIERD